ncbi:hypothetical protein C8P64_2020 [Christiangramia gaetbulicola]|uniref:Uncharacterized protein n=1 Tax=Christiangramia gaetbulicola TaxID=703340 RepID=A0A2T6AI69_9FLAO|nr:hypothetical protein [Christiangramia gaetbulicola]PTX43492.1 hypothetical protein C8P64_2020 [Christiangramia gaetbulicola]
MRKYLILFLLIVSATTLFGQGKENYIISFEENSAWINNFKTAEFENRTRLLKQRLVADQEIYFSPAYSHGKTPKQPDFDTISHVRPLYLIKTKGEEQVFLPANPDKTLVKKLASILDQENIASLELKEDETTKVIYGVRGSYGIIVIDLKNKDLYTQLKELIQDPA